MPTHIAHICLCLPTHNANPKAKSKECNRQRFIQLRSEMLKSFVEIMFNILHYEQNLILYLRELKAGATRYKLHKNYEAK